MKTCRERRCRHRMPGHARYCPRCGRRAKRRRGWLPLVLVGGVAAFFLLAFVARVEESSDVGDDAGVPATIENQHAPWPDNAFRQPHSSVPTSRR